MKAKLTLGAVVLLFFLASPVYAQGGELTTDNLFARMKTELNLTQAQIEAAKPIVEEYTAKLQQLRQSLKDEGVAYDSSTFKQMEKLRDEENQKLIQILTPEQAKKWNDKQTIANILNRGQTGDNDWASKNNAAGLGINF